LTAISISLTSRARRCVEVPCPRPLDEQRSRLTLVAFHHLREKIAGGDGDAGIKTFCNQTDPSLESHRSRAGAASPVGGTAMRLDPGQLQRVASESGFQAEPFEKVVPSFLQY